MKYKYWEIEIDGPDKAGKDLVCKYLCEMSGWRFSINVRGLMSQQVYAKKFGRDYEYDVLNFNKNKILILLTGEPEDLAIRCKLTNEPEYNIKKDLELFESTARHLEEAFNVLYYNTTYISPYHIAKKVIAYIDKLEEENRRGEIQ